VDDKPLLPIFWDRSDWKTCYWWALRYLIHEYCRCLSGGWQVFISSPLQSVKLGPTLKNRHRRVGAMRSIVQYSTVHLSCMNDGV
jgi:3-mercaptopyruvate sulfurtransferase SseA